MAEQIPAPLKLPEISRFLNRANQLRSFKPAISYWCEYHAVNHIVKRNLHTTDEECFAFTKTLLERLETVKAERSDDDAIIDNAVGRAYVELFGQETFDRADRALRANKVTRQTADTFDAAATFFDLAHEWGPPEPDVLQKIKFAKWNAARILKAIREGKDPNESNPKPRETDEELAMDLDPLDPAVQQITGEPRARAAYVEDVPDAGEPAVAAAAAATVAEATEAVEPEGYLPPQPSVEPAAAEETMPGPFQPISIPAAQLHPPPSLPVATPPVSAAAPFAPPGRGGSGPFASDQKSINEAQKHAKWAISALNFEDVPTAVKELRNALTRLGAL